MARRRLERLRSAHSFAPIGEGAAGRITAAALSSGFRPRYFAGAECDSALNGRAGFGPTEPSGSLVGLGICSAWVSCPLPLEALPPLLFL
jgi:hypothetical protein